ncbi:MAG: tetratricopeptide repeat protein [Armatimonadetes bacterium]|nr:tetratricopeptide repeat protein [Armatimonadota bacterium]
MFDKFKGMFGSKDSLAGASATTLVAEARFEQKNGALGKAASLFEQAVRTDEGHADAHRGLADLYLLQGKEDDALRHFERAVALEPTMQDAHYQIGRIYLGRKDVVKATRAFQKELEVTPKYARVHNDLAVAYFHQKDFARAIHHADEAKALGEPVHEGFLKALAPYRR